jgi:hypothetical protein
MNFATWSSSSPYIIGLSPTADLASAARHELLYHVLPLVSPSRTGGTDNAMERYACHIIKEVVAMSGIGFIQFTNEGCLSDLLYSLHPGDAVGLGIQVKTTRSSFIKKWKTRPNFNRKVWRFGSINKNYQGLLLLFRCIMDGKTWLIPNELLRSYYNGDDLTIYDEPKHEHKLDMRKFEVTNDQLAPKIYEYFRSITSSWLKPLSIIQALTPIALTHQKEQQRRLKLLAMFEQVGLRTRPPDVENGPYDFWVEDLKIQDKSAYPEIDQQPGLHANVCRNDREKHRPYDMNDFSFLAIHLPGIYSESFYLISMGALIKHNIVTTVDQHGKTSMLLYPVGVRETRKPVDKWANKFIFHYNDPELPNKILSLYCQEQLRKHRSTPPPQLRLKIMNLEVSGVCA